MRITHLREHWVPKDHVETLKDDALGLLVTKSPCGRIVMAFQGRAQKPAFYTRFRSIERANEYVSDWIQSIKRRADEKSDRRETAKNAANTLSIGDVLVSSWGYDQTNVDYYQVTDLIGKRTVLLRKIAGASETTGHDHGTCTPVADAYISEPFRKQVTASGGVKISRDQWARPLGFDEVDGVRVYKKSHWTSYR